MTRIILVDDHAILLRGLSMILETVEGCQVVAATTDGAEVGRLLQQHDVDVIVTDAVMPGVDGLQIVREFGGILPVLVLTTFDDAHLVRDLVNAGAAGYLLKAVSASHLAESIQAVAEGGIVLDPRIVRVLRQKAPAALTRAEKQVAELVAQGMNNRQIAEQLYLAEGTVKNHVSVLLRKMGAADRTVLALNLARIFGRL